jgi:hypothetical protein
MKTGSPTLPKKTGKSRPDGLALNLWPKVQLRSKNCLLPTHWVLRFAQIEATLCPMNKRRATTFLCVTFVLFIFAARQSLAQAGKASSSEDLLIEGDIANHNLLDALDFHFVSNPEELLKKQEPQEKVLDFGILVFESGKLQLDWTTGQHARYLLEEIRQAIHQLQSASCSIGLDGMAIDNGRAVWPKLRDLTCQEYPSMVTANPAMRGRLKTGHVEWPKTGVVLPCRSEFGKAGFGRAVTC